MKVLFSIPTSAPSPSSVHLPSSAQFTFIASEAALSTRWMRRVPWPGGLSEYLVRLSLAIHLIAARRKYDAVVTGRYGEYFALFQSLWPFGRKPLLLMDVEWYSTPSGGRQRIGAWLHRMVARGASRIQVFCRIEARNYSDHFEIPRDKFVWIPYCGELHSEAESSVQGVYIFSGGSHHRDYATLFAAVSGLPIEVRIAAPPDAFKNLTAPENVRFVGHVSAQEYWRLVNGATLVALSLEPNLRRCPGVITYVKAMMRGKCVVVNEPNGAPDYIEHGRTGFIVAPSDHAGLRERIQALLSEPQRMATVGANARQASRERFGPATYYAEITKVVQELF
jgi:glycosyltransferase involved in cell wall biosynthesis